MGDSQLLAGYYVVILGLIFVTTKGSNDINHGGHGWHFAHATFYGDINGGDTMYGACGYGDLFKQGYGLETAALSTALFNDGAACGACFQITCIDSKWCKQGARPIRVTATNFCPPWYEETPQAWCNPPRKHFDLSMPMFLKIAEYKGGIVPVLYRKVKCHKKGGVKFELKGNSYWLMVLVYNAGGVGDVAGVNIKGSKTSWTQMTRNWGQNWQTWTRLDGQSLSFQVSTSNGKTFQFNEVVPADWQIGRTYESRKNMH
ncbi:expansin-A23-like [Chenopodium quinoa]|uniref:Expansin n=1 Tax=Chenopodium quinoa TaxID=63459 RepID=A0A803M0V2_CHEQI|nr:expansin-A23-like [Chenopodium quinoa]